MRKLMFVSLAFAVAAPAAAGTITGTVKVTENNAPVTDATVVVYVVGPPNDAGAKQTQQIRQKNRTFVPDLVALTIGDDVTFPNDDPGFHNVFSPKPKFDLGTLKKGENKDKPQTFKEPDR
jgi:plastocyanin